MFRIGKLLDVSTEKVEANRDCLRAARSFLRLGQDDLACAAGVARGTLSALENGTGASHEATRRAVQQALEQRGIVFTNGGKPGFYFDPARVTIPTRVS